MSYYDDEDRATFFEHKPKEEPSSTEPVCRKEELVNVFDLDSDSNPVRYRYYCEIPNSKDDMVRDIFFDMTVTEIRFSTYNVKAEYSYFYGDEDDPDAYGGLNCYKRYEWEGNIFCARSAEEEIKSAVEEYNQQNGGKDSIFVDERRSKSQLEDDIRDMWDAIRKTRSHEPLQNTVFNTLDSLGLRSYESETPAKRHCYNRGSIAGKWRREGNRRTAALIGAAVPYVAKGIAEIVGEGFAMYVDERKRMHELSRPNYEFIESYDAWTKEQKRR